MKILKKLTIKNLKLNSKRTIVTIIGIILSTALLCAAAGLATSFQATLKEDAKRNQGDFHLTLYYVSEDDLKYIEENRKIADYTFTKSLGYSAFEDSFNPDKPYYYLMAFTNAAYERYSIELLEGRLPENSDEVVISEHVYTNGGKKHAIGDEITLTLGTRLSDGYQLGQYDSYLNPDYYEDEEESLVLTGEEETYTIVGVIARPVSAIEPFNAPGYTVITKLEDTVAPLNVVINATKTSDVEELVETLNPDYKYNMYINDVLLTYDGEFLSNNTLISIYLIFGVVLAIIVISSVFVIRNSFAISITEKNRQYGMLRSIGATKKQIKRAVLYEGLILGTIGTILGIIIGVLTVKVLVVILNIILKDMFEIVYSMSIYPIIIAVVLSFVTIYLSTIKSAKKAAKISPIEAIRETSEIKINPKKLKTPKIINKLFGLGGTVAYKNMKRNKKQYRTVTISLIVSIFIFVALSSFIEYGFKTAEQYYQELNYDVFVDYFNDEDEEKIKVYEQIQNKDNIIRSTINRKRFAKLNVSGRTTAIFKEQSISDNNYEIDIPVYALSEKEYTRYKEEIGLKDDQLILIDGQTIFYSYDEASQEVKEILSRRFNYETGDEITLTFDDNKKLTKELFYTSKLPLGVLPGTNGAIIVNASDALEYGLNVESLYIESDDSKALTEEINKMKQEDIDLQQNLYVTDYGEQARETEAVILTISIFFYGFISVITLISVTNIFNTITTSMTLRRREFAMLKSIGMTNKEFKKMISLESLFLGIKACLFGIPLGIIVSYLVYLGFNYNMEMPYKLPYFAILIAFVFVMLIIGIIMRYSLKKQAKQNIIETIRKETI